ncbi:MAG: hypothetical protein RRZ38_11850 [Hafnia sp.]
MWQITKFLGYYHVLPVNDTKQHSFKNCECGVKYDDGVYVHNSYDGRELLEEAQVETKIHS